MRKITLAAAALASLAALTFSAPVQAMAISAPAALKSASDDLRVSEPVYYCYGACGYGYRPYYGYRSYYRPYYRPYYGYRPYYRPYYGYRPYYRPYYGYRPYYRPYYGYGYGYRPYYRPYYGYYAPRPRFYFGPRVYSW